MANLGKIQISSKNFEAAKKSMLRRNIEMGLCTLEMMPSFLQYIIGAAKNGDPVAAGVLELYEGGKYKV